MAAGDDFRRRPPEAMPREFRTRTGTRRSTVAAPASAVAAPQAILPGAREQRELEGPVFRVGRERGEQRAHELMGVLADAAPVPQRGTIVDQNTHLFKSFRVSILL